jgi:hypothetical protein
MGNMPNDTFTCWQEGDFCDGKDCPHWIDWLGTGNCVLRIQREHTLTEIGVAFGFSKQRAEKVLEKALNKFKAKLIQMAATDREVMLMLEQLGVDSVTTSVVPWAQEDEAGGGESKDE